MISRSFTEAELSIPVSPSDPSPDLVARTLRAWLCPACGATAWLYPPVAADPLCCALCRACRPPSAAATARWLYPAPLGGGGRDVSPAASLAPATGLTVDPAADPASSAASAPARRMIGRYALEAELGRGGMGVVYAARDEVLDRALALKVLIAGAYASVEARHRFIAEARAVAALKHPSLVPVFDMGESDGLPWFVMERVHGPTLDDVIRIGGPLPEAEAIRVTALVSRAVHHAHETGLAHRDIKPGNVLMEGDGRPRVTDFGLVRPLDGPMGVTATKQVLGTPAYLAGEVARGESNVDWLRVDVFGLGALLYTALSGRPPALGRSSAQVLQSASSGRRLPLVRSRPDLSPAVLAIVDQAMHYEPLRRYASALHLAEDLERALAGEAVLALPERPVERGARLLRRHRGPLALSLLGLLTVAVALGWSPTLAWLALREREAGARVAWTAIQAMPEGEARAAQEAKLAGPGDAGPVVGLGRRRRARVGRGDDAPQPRGLPLLGSPAAARLL